MPHRKYAVATLMVLLTMALLSGPAFPVPALFNDGIFSATGQDIYYAWVEFSDKKVRSEEHLQELLAELT